MSEYANYIEQAAFEDGLEQGRRESRELIERLQAEVDAWRERFPVAGFDGNSIVLSG